MVRVTPLSSALVWVTQPPGFPALVLQLAETVLGDHVAHGPLQVVLPLVQAHPAAVTGVGDDAGA